VRFGSGVAIPFDPFPYRALDAQLRIQASADEDQNDSLLRRSPHNPSPGRSARTAGKHGSAQCIDDVGEGLRCEITLSQAGIMSVDR